MKERKPIQKEIKEPNTSQKRREEVKTYAMTYTLAPEDISWYKVRKEVREVFHI